MATGTAVDWLGLGANVGLSFSPLSEGVVTREQVHPDDPDFQAALAMLQARYATIFDRVTEYTGGSGLEGDEDGLLTVLFTPALNDQDVPPAFATAVDLVDRSVCPASDEQAIVYGTIPDVDYSQPLVAVDELRTAMADAPPHLAHELTHVFQNVVRIG